MKTKNTITTKHQPSPQSLYLCMLYHVHSYILESVGPGYDVSTLENEDMALSPNIYIYVLVYSFVIIQDVPGGMDKTSGECSLC